MNKEITNLFLTAPIMSALVNRMGEFIEVNHAWEKFSGLTKDTLVKQSFLSFVYEDDKAASILQFARLTQGEISEVQFENRYQHYSQEYCWLLWQIVPLADSVDTFYVVATNIDNYRVSLSQHEQLCRHQERYMLAASAGKTGVCDWNLQTQKGYLDPNLKALLGYKDEEIPNTFNAWHSYIHPNDQGWVIDRLQNYISGHIPHYEIEHRRIHKNGDVRWFISRGYIMRDKKDVAYRLIGTCTDITERKLAEQALQTQVEHNHLILENLTDGFFMTDKQGKILETNPTFHQLLGFDDLKSTELNVSQLEANDTRPSLMYLFQKTVDEGARRIETRLRHKAGHTLDVEMSISFIEITGENRFLNFIHDISHRKQTEKVLLEAKEAAETANRYKNEFLASMSHEIRTPMNGVIGMTELLETTKLDPQQQHYVKMIRISGEGLLTVISDILDFSKIEANQLILDINDFDPNMLIDDVINLFATSAHNKGLELICDLPPVLPSRLSGDASRLRQVLNNLLGNAIKFTEDGEVILKIVIVEEQDKHIMLRFEVHDTGIGVSEKDHECLFKPFSQVDGSSTRCYGGTGLGLAISQRLVEKMKGQIGVESEKNKGSIFWFALPLEKLPESAIKLPDTSILRNLKVLIVDDNATNCEILCNQVMHWGLYPDKVTSAKKALVALSEAAENSQPYHFALIDFMMPHMDGLSLAKAVKRDEKIASTALIMLTSIHQPMDNEVTKQLLSYCLPKPVSRYRLLDVLLHVIGGARKPVFPTYELTFSTIPPTDNSVCRVLLAEDNIINQEVGKDILGKFGCEVIIAEDGQDAFDLMQKEKFDLIFMDCYMPQMDGFEATSKILDYERTHQYQHTPIIALTANAMQGDRERCISAGMDDYLSKPVKSKELQRVLKTWLPQSPQPKCLVDVDAAPKNTKQSQKIDKVVDNKEEIILNEVLALPPVNFKSLEHMRQEMKGRGIAWLIKLYLRELPNYLEELQVALEEGDGEKLYLSAHKFKGSSTNLGAQQVVSLCKMIEAMAKSGELESAAELVKHLQESTENLREVLEVEKEKG